MSTPTKIHEEVRQHYGEFARTGGSCCATSKALYPMETLRGLPADIVNFTAGNGDPVAPARLQPGETVLDLGSGGGLDCFIAARQVGDQGRVIGVDMTPEMLARARASARRLNLKNVEFREGYLEAIPVEANTVDVVISNCVINLSPDKSRVFAEIFRVLKPGGRISISDTVTNRPVSAELVENRGEWCGCVSGALPYDDYVAGLSQAGFTEIRLEPNFELAEEALTCGGIELGGEDSEERVKSKASNWEKCQSSVFLPHLIFARKPA